jgi:riboflavin kinase / FMN adenylyltransferase
MTVSTWYTGAVQHGQKLGRTIGFPTINLDAHILSSEIEKGVYACTVDVDGHIYGGALYYGPRLVLDETKDVLEIHILGFDQDVYGKEIQFKLRAFIRPPLDFPSFDEFKVQLEKDVEEVKTYLNTSGSEK